MWSRDWRASDWRSIYCALTYDLLKLFRAILIFPLVDKNDFLKYDFCEKFCEIIHKTVNSNYHEFLLEEARSVFSIIQVPSHESIALLFVIICDPVKLKDLYEQIGKPIANMDILILSLKSRYRMRYDEVSKKRIKFCPKGFSRGQNTHVRTNARNLTLPIGLMGV